MKKNNLKTQTRIIILIFFICNIALCEETYFNLSEKEIQIQTDFNGKELIIFGTLQNNYDIIILQKDLILARNSVAWILR